MGLSLALLMRLGLLFAIAWLVTLTRMITVFDWTFSGRDLILYLVVLFLLYKALVSELHERMEGRLKEFMYHQFVYAEFYSGSLAQIVVLDAVFLIGLEVITAIGMVDNIYVMMIAMIVDSLSCWFASRAPSPVL